MARTDRIIAALVLVAIAAACERTGDAGQPASEGAPATPSAVGPVPGVGDASVVPNPVAGNPQARMNGRRLFAAYNCAGCHGEHGGGGMGPSLRDDSWIYGGTDADIFDSIAQGRANGMPAWGTLLPAQQIWPIAAYIRSMRTPDEPEPPEW
jgi:cytochrome c oxidase cbb3-type subunit 3